MLVADPLQTLAPQDGPSGPVLQNEMMLPAVLDPWAGHALFEAANLAAKNPGSQVWLVCLGPKAKLQQVMMAVSQKAPFQLVVADGTASGFADAYETAKVLSDTIDGIAGLDVVFHGEDPRGKTKGGPIGPPFVINDNAIAYMWMTRS